MWWAYLGALLIGVSLGLLGSGGSILTVPMLLYLVGEPEKLAIAESLGIVATISLFGAVPYIRKKEVHWQSLLFFGIPGMFGTYGGASISKYLTGTTQLLIFAVVMLIAAVMMIKKPKNEVQLVPKQTPKWLLMGEGLSVGVLTGLVGVGGGFLIIPSLILLTGLSMRLAVGTSLLIITLQSSIGFLKYTSVLAEQNLQINWDIMIIFAFIGILGSFLGNIVGAKISQKNLKKGFGYFLVMMGVFIIYKSIL